MVKKWYRKWLEKLRYKRAVSAVNAAPVAKSDVVLACIINTLELIGELPIRNKELTGRYTAVHADFANLLVLLDVVILGMRRKVYIDRTDMKPHKRKVTAYAYLMDDGGKRAMPYSKAVDSLNRTLRKLQESYVIIKHDDGLKVYYDMLLSSLLSESCIILNIYGENKWQSTDEVLIRIKNR